MLSPISCIYHVPKAGQPFRKDHASRVIITKDPVTRMISFQLSRDLSVENPGRMGFDERPERRSFGFNDAKTFGQMTPQELAIWCLNLVRHAYFVEGDILVVFDFNGTVK